MSWLYSRALVEASLAAGCSAGEPSVPSRSTPMPQAFSSPDRTTAFSRLSRYGMTCEPLTDTHGAALLTWSRAVSRARTSASPARARASTARAAGSGRRWRGSLARFDRRSRSWRTAQRCLFADSSESWVTWPRSGMTADGRCWELAISAPRISATVYGFSLPTPVASDGSSGAVIGSEDLFYTTGTGMPRKINRNGKDGSVGLARLVHMWPTPAASEGGQSLTNVTEWRGRTAYRGNRKVQIGLRAAVKAWPTPPGFSPDGRRNGSSGKDLGRAVNRSLPFRTPNASDGPKWSRQTLAERVAKRQQVRLGHQIGAGGSLNPTWVEWLMGWPLGWTDFASSATAKSRSAPQRRGSTSSQPSTPTSFTDLSRNQPGEPA